VTAFVIAPSSTTTTPTNLFFEVEDPLIFRGGGIATTTTTNSTNTTTTNDDEMNVVETTSSSFNPASTPLETTETGGTLGDIMNTEPPPSSSSSSSSSALSSSTSSGLVMNENPSLNDRYPNCYFTPMERIALTANGNLQRIFASYYDTPVTVKVISCVLRQSPPHHHQQQEQEYNNNNNEGENNTMVWDRVVHIQIYNQTVCKATSVIQVNCPTCCELITSQTVGIAQMFRHLNRLPTFTLLNAGRRSRAEVVEEGKEVNDDDDDEFSLKSKNGGIWRTYELQCEEMSCLIHEEFASDAWSIRHQYEMHRQ
jgi:hypothetical protein